MYIDDICSEESREIVEEHIRCCDKCRQKLESMENPIECPAMADEGKSKEPFKKIRKKARIRLIVTVLLTISIMGSGMFAVQEVGWLHDYFYPMQEAVIESEDGQSEWVRVTIEGSDFLKLSSIFYEKELVNDANSSGSVDVRILDEQKNCVIEAADVKAGESISLKKLENDTNYIVEVRCGGGRCGEGRYFLNFV